MKTLTVKLNKYKTNVDIINNDNLQKRILHILLFTIGLLSFFYLMFWGNTVFNIIERQSISKESRILANEVGELELEYLSISNKVDMTLAMSLGFKENNNKKYAIRRSLDTIKLAKNEI